MWTNQLSALGHSSPQCSHLLQLNPISVILHHVYGGEKAVPWNVHSACPWNMDPTHVPAGGGEWEVYVCVCLQEGDVTAGRAR